MLVNDPQRTIAMKRAPHSSLKSKVRIVPSLLIALTMCAAAGPAPPAHETERRVDVIHGYRTIFPIPLGEASSWDPAAVERSSQIAAAEAAATGLKWTFAPMVDIARDPRWGRISEGSGEDPYLGAVIARARVRGFQGDDPSAADRILACAKHWVAYGAAEGGRDYNSVDLSEQTLRTIYFPPFRAALEAGAGSVMSSFNTINGVPASANPFTLTQVLRKEWHFDGLVVSDYGSVKELLAQGVAVDDADAARQALLAGID